MQEGQKAAHIRSCNMPSMSMGELWRIWLLSALVVHGAVAGNPDAKRLYDDLLSNYNKLVRPVINTSDVLRVCIKLKLSQLIDVVSIIIVIIIIIFTLKYIYFICHMLSIIHCFVLCIVCFTFIVTRGIAKCELWTLLKLLLSTRSITTNLIVTDHVSLMCFQINFTENVQVFINNSCARCWWTRCDN